MLVVRSAQLRALYESMMNSLGASKEEAEIVADMFVTADLLGVEWQGIRSINRHVINRVRKGVIKLGQTPKVLKETRSMALIDGRNELGQIICKRAMELAVEKAENTGVGVVSIRNLGDTGMLAYYTTMALKHDCIGIMCNNTGPAVAPWGGEEKVLGIDPISIAIPAGKQLPIIIDMAVTRGEDKFDRKTMQPPFVDPLLFFNSVREYCLGIIVDLLSAGLSGMRLATDAAFGREGGFCMALHIPHFQPIDEFKKRVDRYIIHIKYSKRVNEDKDILMPGERGLREREKRLAEGIPVPDEVWEDTKSLAQELGVNWKTAVEER